MQPGARVAVGTCDGTGAAINVCLGWRPSWVKVLNMEDAGTLYPAVEWFDQQRLITVVDEGIMHEGD